MRTVGDSMGDGVLDRPPGQLDGQDHGQVRVCASGCGIGCHCVECAPAYAQPKTATGGVANEPMSIYPFTTLR